jgi:hypothetical protein
LPGWDPCDELLPPLTSPFKFGRDSPGWGKEKNATDIIILDIACENGVPQLHRSHLQGHLPHLLKQRFQHLQVNFQA